MIVGRVVSLIVIIAMIGLSVPVGALWETHQGSDSRPNHCQPVSEPSWSMPGLEWVYTNNASFPKGAPSWVVPAENTLWASEADRLLLTLPEERGRLEIHNENFERIWSVEFDSIFPFAELVDVEGTGVPQIMVPAQGRALYDLQGELIRRYEPEPMSPGMSTAITFIWPAVGDFTGDGRTELVFSGDWEWHGFRADGELIARENTLADERNEGGWFDIRAHTENGQDYAYLLTRSRGDFSETIHSRLHKVVLEPTIPHLGSGQPGAPIGLPPAFQDTLLPYRFEKVWMTEFQTSSIDFAISFFDLTGDGSEEIIVGHYGRPIDGNGGFSILNLEGEVLYSLEEPVAGFAAVGDMTGDGVQEVVSLVTPRWPESGQWLDPPSHVVGVQWNGAKFEQIYRFQADEEFGGRFLALCDVDGDGADELLVALGEPSRVPDERGISAGEGKAKLFDSNGTILWEYRMFFGQPWYGVIIDDFTGDGAYEFIIPNNAGQVLVFSPSQDSSIDDYKRVFDALLDRGNRMPSEEQIQEWLAEVEGDASEDGSPGDAAGEEPEAGAAPFSALTLVTAAVVVVWRARRS